MALPTFNEAPASGWLDSRLIAIMRLVLSSSVLFIIGPSDLEIGPADLEPPVGVFHILAALYTAYSALLFMDSLGIVRIAARSGGTLASEMAGRHYTWPSPRQFLESMYIFVRRQVQRLRFKMSYWADLSWAALLTVSSDESSIAFLFLFSTLIASFQWSFVAALRLTIVAAKLLGAIGFVKVQMGADLRLHEIILPPIYLLVFGYLVACWGNREAASKRRLVLLKEITGLSNPRFGIDRMIGTMMERLRAFHDAEACVMIVTDPATNEYLLRRADRRDPERAIVAEPIPAETARLLLAPPLEQAMIYLGAPQLWEWWRSPQASYYGFDVRKGRRIAPVSAMHNGLIALMDAESFISLPVHYPDSTIGRLYLTAARRRAFSPADMGFLLQVVEQIVPVIENIRLVNQLASSAAEEERRRLARDIHDSVIQSYIGFRIGLAAVSQKLQAGTDDVANDIAQLIAITDQEIGALRDYVHRLPGGGKRESVLLAAVRRFAVTFTEATRIAVQVEAEPDLYINDRLVAEVFQMIVEGLSNIRRHTEAACASIGLARQNGSLIVRIANDGADTVAPAQFSPWSIAERAAALGGQANVEHVAGGGTQVIVEIPL
jgi:signal transduction histidine kinase